MGFRGDDFVLLAGECLGEGQDDTQPMDTWLANRLWGNTMWLASEPRTICWSPVVADPDLSTATGIKPYAIMDKWATVWAGMMYIYPGQRGLTISTIGIIESSGTGTKNVYIRATVEGLGDSGEDTLYARTETGAGVLSIGRDKITVTFDETFIAQAPELRWVEVSMRSEGIVSRYSAVTGSGQSAATGYLNDSSVTPVFVNSSSGNPDADSLEQMVVEFPYSGLQATTVNLLGVTAIGSSKESETSRAYTIELLPTTATFAWDYDIEYLTFWSPRALVFELDMDLESAGRIARATLEPNLPVDYGPAMMQVDAIHQIHRRPRVVGVGPRGAVDSTEAHYGALGYRFCWPYVMGDDAAKTVIDDSIYLTTENPIVEIQGWCVVVQHASNTNTDAPLPGVLGKRKVEGKATPGQVAWDITATLTQMEDAASGSATWATDATSYGSYTETENFKLHPTNMLANVTPSPLARGLEHMWQGMESAAGDQYGWFKEGSLVDEQDYGYLQPFTIRIDTSGMTSTEVERAFRLKVTLEHNTAARNDYLRIVNSGSEASVRFVLGHYTVNEIPRNGRGTPVALDELKTIPTDLVLPVPEDHQPKGYIKASAWQHVMESLHYEWQRAGSLIPGMVWDTPWQTTSTSYTGTNGNGDVDLTSWVGSGILKRANPDGTYTLAFEAYIANLDVQISVLRFDDRVTLSSLGSVTLSNSTTDAKWVTGALAIAAADAMEGGAGSTPAVLYIYAKAKVPSSGTGYIWQVG